jgi:hypothetical protein
VFCVVFIMMLHGIAVCGYVKVLRCRMVCGGYVYDSPLYAGVL